MTKSEAPRTLTFTITVPRRDRAMVRELLIISHAKEGTGVLETKRFGYSEFEITGTARALKVLGRAFQL